MSLQVCDTLSGSFVGLNSPGAITLSGARVGDIVLKLYIAPASDTSSSFERTISVDDEIQQTSGSPLSTFTFIVFLLRPVAVS